MKTKSNLTWKTAILLLSIIFRLQTSAQTVRVENGLIKGTTEDGITSFKGIPFAEPPIGELRWKPPQPVKNWEGVLEANKFAPASMQPNLAVLGYLNYGMSEDCLYLNIWKPENSPEKKLPVLVWIHGGGFIVGSTSQAITTGEQLAKKDIVVVSIAYRLGKLGFLAHPELSAESENHTSGNYGFLDQIAALKWIQKNIEAFDGDPDNITIFGESAGGQSVSVLCASPLAKNLFHKAICMSGGAFMPAGLKNDFDSFKYLEDAESDGLKYTKSLGTNSLADLRNLDPQKFVGTLNDSTAGILVVDGYVIPDELYSLYDKGIYNDVPVIIGNTSGEGYLFILTANDSEYEKNTLKHYGPNANKILELYPAGDKETTRKSMSELFRDTYFGWQTYIWATLQTKTGISPVYAYYFNQSQPASAVTMLVKSQDAYHGSDCVYVFDHLDQDPNFKYSDDDKNLSKAMVDYWVNFARYGNPNGEGLPQWPAFNTENQKVMIFNSNYSSGIFPNLDGIKTIDKYYIWKRSKEN
ncbi:MAG: carboxylesterase family protein [Prolixibacteraceae bacterium]|nr:carboxylesterase family protein [Prolixibacteraceae bacterium]